MIKVHLGCGYDTREGFDNFDIVYLGGNKVLDLEKDNLPYQNDTVDYVYSGHFLEHLHDVRHCLNECWRVLKEGGIFEAKVPNGLWTGAAKPVHHQIITACWFDFLTRDDNFKHYGFFPWKIIELKDNDIEVFCKMTPNKKI